MFGGKSRKIVKLEAELEREKLRSDELDTMLASKIGQRDMEINRLKEANTGLTADRDNARDSIGALSAERNQFAKRIEELEEAAKRHERGVLDGREFPPNAHGDLGRIVPGDEPERDISEDTSH